MALLILLAKFPQAPAMLAAELTIPHTFKRPDQKSSQTLMVFVWTVWTCHNRRLMEVLIRTTGITTSVGSGIPFAALNMINQHGISPSWVGERR